MKPFVIQPGGGEVFQYGEGTVEVVALPDATGIGAFSIETFPPGFASPLHVHSRDAGVFFLFEGSIRLKCGELDVVAEAGSTIFLPPGVPHAFKVVGDVAARWFNVQSPHGDFIFRAMGRPFPASDGAQPLVVMGPFPE